MPSDVAVLALLDFLTGFTIEDVRRRLALASVNDVEQLLRSALLLHGYTVAAARD